MKCVVVGGGVIGTSIAWHTAKAGIADVVLLERGQTGCGTTSHSAGNINWKPLPDHDEPTLYLLETVAQLEAQVEQSIGWLRTGRTFLANSSAVRQAFEGFDKGAKEKGIETRWIESSEAKKLNPLMDPSTIQGIWFNSLCGRLNPSDLTSAYASAARLSGAQIRENVAILGIRVNDGRVTGVDTTNGFVAADVVVVAAGLWSRGLLEPLGIALAQWSCEHFYVIANVSPRLARDTPSWSAPDAQIYGREEVGRFLVGCFDDNAKTIDPASLPDPFSFALLPPDWDKIAPYFERATRIFPALENAPIHHFVNGPETFTPDGLPLIGRISSVRGLLVATAMNSAGVTWSAMTGSLIADLLAEVETKFDGRRYDPMRFGEAGQNVVWLKAQVSNVVSAGYRKKNLKASDSIAR